MITIALASVFVALRLAVFADGDETKFVVAGEIFTDPEKVPDGLFVRSDVGYDGNYYYRLALDPLNWDDTAFGITIVGDNQLRRDRIFYPAVVHVLSLGSEQATPWVMILVNIASLGAIAGLGAVFARSHGRAPIWGLLFLAFPLFLFSLARDLTEPLEVALVMAALLALRRERWLWATAALSCAVLTREPALVIVAALGAERMYRWVRREARPGLADLPWIVPGVVFAGWQGIIHANTGRFGFTGGDAGVTAPFFGLPEFVEESFNFLKGFEWPGLRQNGEAFVLLFMIVLGAFALRKTAATRPERWAFVALAIFASTFLGAGSWLEQGGIRAFSDLFALSVLMLIASPWRLAVPAAVGGTVSAAVAVQLVRDV